MVGTEVAEHGHRGVARRPDGGESLGRNAVAEHDDLGAMFDPIEPLGALCVGEHQLALAQIDSVGQFLAGPPAVEQRGAAARHQDAHIGDDPVGRIARGNADPVALGDPVLGREAVRDMRGRAPHFAEGQPHLAIDDEQLVLLLVAEMREIMRHAGRRILERGHGDAAPGDFGQLEHLAGFGHCPGDPVDILVELCRHGLFRVLSKSARGLVLEARA